MNDQNEKSISMDSTKQLSKKKKFIYSIILILLPFIFFFLIELILRIAGYGADLSLFKKSERHPGYYEINNYVTKRFFNKFKGTKTQNDIFLINKPDSCYRIFVMGGSTAAGFPYENGISFSRILHHRLQDAFPNTHIEVVNVAMDAINSYALVDYTNEIIKQKPDAVLIYAGHNEFYGAFGVSSVEIGGNVKWVKRVHLSLIHLRGYQLLQKAGAGFAKMFSSKDINPNKGSLMERMAEDKIIVPGSDIYKAGISQYSVNMDVVLNKFKIAGIPVILSELISNIANQEPFISIVSQDYPVKADWFEYGNKLEKQMKYDSARIAYYKAKDLDGIMFRAPEDINKTIHHLAKKYTIPVVPLKNIFESHSPHGLIGENLLLEHLHPNIDGYFLMANAFFKTMQKNNYIASSWDTTLIKPSTWYRQNWGFTAFDSLVAELKIKTLKDGWPFKKSTPGKMYIYVHKAQNLEDSAAVECLQRKDISMERKHKELAAIYYQRGDSKQAFEEYYSLVKSYPNHHPYYYAALNYALEASLYNKALYMMLSMPDKDNSYHAWFEIGKLYLKINQPNNAVISFEKAKSVMDESDNIEMILTYLYDACIKANDQQKTAIVFTELKKVNPDFNPNDTIGKDDVFVYVDEEIREIIQKAFVLKENGQTDSALVLFQKSLEIKKSFIANRSIGLLLLQKQNKDAIDYIAQAYQTNPKDISTLDMLVVYYIIFTDIEKADKYYNELEKISKNTERLYELRKGLEMAKEGN